MHDDISNGMKQNEWINKSIQFENDFPVWHSVELENLLSGGFARLFGWYRRLVD